MKHIINVGGWDRFLRALAGVAAALLATFWVAGVAQVVAWVVAGVLLLTALAGFCPAYRLFGVRTSGHQARGSNAARGRSRLKWGLAVLVLVATAAGGAYASQFLSRKFFLEDFNAMNGYYKQTLFLTGKGERGQAVANYEQLLSAYGGFQAKYMDWQPFSLRTDEQFPGDLGQVAGILQGVNDLVRTGDLQKAHLMLEGVRPVFQDVFKRNGFSMLAVSLVDFHDAMERMLDAAHAKDAARLQSLYPEVDGKMKAIEAEARDADILAIRAKLDGLYKAALDGETEVLPQRGDQLKSSFVKVYLQRG